MHKSNPFPVLSVCMQEFLILILQLPFIIFFLIFFFQKIAILHLCKFYTFCPKIALSSTLDFPAKSKILIVVVTENNVRNNNNSS